MSRQTKEELDKKESANLAKICLQFKEMRVAKGISVDSIAAALRLNADLIAALEDHDTARLPSRIFVIGYIRGYARQLGLDESELAQLDLPAAHHSVDLVSRLPTPSDTNSRHISVHLTTYMVIAVLLFLLAAWWLSIQMDIVSITGVEQPQSLAESGLIVPDVVEDEAEVGIEHNFVEGQPYPPQMEAVSEDVAVVETGESAAVAEAAQADEVTATDEAALADEAAQADGVTVIDRAVAGEIAQTELKIAFIEDSWAEISDASETRLLYGLYTKGDQVVVNGEAPFNLFFGYAPGAIITFNEEQFDHTKFHRDGVARFAVGRADDNHVSDSL